MKTEQIVKALLQCADEECKGCPYYYEKKCDTMLLEDAAKLIAEQDERIAIMSEC